MDCTSLGADKGVGDMLTLANLIGPMSFGALSFLLAAVALFRDLKAQQIIITVSMFRMLYFAVVILAVETVFWLAISVSVAYDTSLFVQSDAWERAAVGVMAFGISIVALILSLFVRRLMQLVSASRLGG